MQYKIPQNVQIEDKIVGPLTLKQLIIVGVGGGITYAIYSILVKQYYIEVWLPAILPSALLTLAIAFLKINGIPFGKWVPLMLVHFKNPRKRSFDLGKGDLYNATIFKQEKSAAPIILEKAGESKEERMKKLSEITKLVDHESI